MDDFDVKILNILQTDSRLTADALADRVGLSATACQRRVKKLRKTGVIAADIAVLSAEAVGQRLTVIVQVTLVTGGASNVDDFRRQMRKASEVQQCYYTTGEFDFLLIITARDMTDYEQLTRRIFFENKAVQRFTTTVVMDTVKVGLHVPL